MAVNAVFTGLVRFCEAANNSRASRCKVSERSEISVGGAETAGSNPLGALADRGLDPARASAGPAEREERDPEVVVTARRRTFTAEYKLNILEQLGRCRKTNHLCCPKTNHDTYERRPARRTEPIDVKSS